MARSCQLACCGVERNCAAGLALAHGDNPYGVYPLSYSFKLDNVTFYAPNLNPPISLPGLAFLSRFDPLDAFWAWFAISVVLYLVTLALLAFAFSRTLTFVHLFWAVSVWGFWQTLQIGNIYIVAFAIVAAAWLSMDRGHHCAAALFVGTLVAMKPQFGLWALALFIIGYQRTALVAVAIAGVLTIAPVLPFGPDVYRQWLNALTSYDYLAFTENVSLIGMASRANIPALGFVASVLMVGASLFWLWRFRPDWRQASALALVTVLVASPTAWPANGLCLLPYLLSRRVWTPPMGIAAGIMVIPSWLIWVIASVVGVTKYNFGLAGDLYCLGFLLLSTELIRQIRSTAALRTGVPIPPPRTPYAW
ncbi:MAG TPA: glycosyltransferase family 87 protein [Chloroflexota bacterium]|nr:glycosyltransferase family 87 protein [Chloroflexota bacterium]